MIKALKKLTPEQCVEIAKIARADVDWKHLSSTDESHTIIENSNVEEHEKLKFIIDLRNSSEIDPKLIKFDTLSYRLQLYYGLAICVIDNEFIYRITNYMYDNFSQTIDSWNFYAYCSNEDYENREYYFVKVFFDYNEMKTFSAKHSKKEKEKFPDYCSRYDKMSFRKIE